MYYRKLGGLRAVTLPDGTILTRGDLPAPDTGRWVASRKLKIVQAVLHGLLTRADALERYALSEEELESWCAAVGTHGAGALKVTALRPSKQP